MSIISIYDLPDFKIKKSPIIKNILDNLRKENKIKEDQYEDVVDFGEFILKAYELANLMDGKRENKNAVRVDKE